MSLSDKNFELATFVILNIVNILWYLLVIAAAIITMLSGGFSEIVLNIYAVLMCIALVVNEIITPDATRVYFRFLCVYRGRGLLFIFFGCLVLKENIFNISIAVLNFSLGLAYIIISYTHLEFLPSLIKNVQNWRDAKNSGLDVELPRHNYSSSNSTPHLSPLSGPTPSPTANGTMEMKRGYSGGGLPEEAMATYRDEMDLGDLENAAHRRQWSGVQDSDYESVAGNARSSALPDDDPNADYEPYIPSTSPFNESEYGGVAEYRASPSLHHVATDYGDGYSTEGSRLTRW